MAHLAIDHQTVKEWIETHGGRPAAVQATSTAKDPGVLCVELPENEEDPLIPISWEVFFDKFERERMALLYEEVLRDGREVRLAKLVKRDVFDFEF